jgi:hypothetical protein
VGSRSALSQLTLPAAPTAPGQTATKAYVDLGLRTVSDLNSITSPTTGQLALLTTDLMIYRHTGSGWLGIMHTTAGGGYAKYKRTSAQSNAFIAATWVRQAFNVAVDTSADVTPNAGFFDMFTLNRGGVWQVDASTRANITNVSAVRYLYGIFPAATPGSSTYKVTTTNEVAADTNSTNLNVSLRRRFAAGDVISVAATRLGNSGAGGGNNAASEANATDEGWCQITFHWRGP